MGSLMAGWDSHVPDPKAEKPLNSSFSTHSYLLLGLSVTYQRNLSFTKGEIESYWRSKKKIEEEHLRAISGLSENSQESTFAESGRMLQRSSSLPLANRRENFMSVDSNTGLEKLIKRNGWWTSSNWAFLNEPPVIAAEGPTYKYASQYHITDFGSSKPDSQAGIST
ncbi:hypothetical protein HHK36_031308 [Tetracentron sinense]|uniref:Uncharacterized protein n=1 Tax=Tetracentron sinense TaxID=13715 RepID=A0A835CZJ4_TETSI|nr:hypothetical protein HHK36_031308 [Tetracentron sinense]